MPAQDPELNRRATDDPEVAGAIVQEIRRQRKRTIIISVVAAGLVSLFIGRAIEVQANNAQVDRNRINCVATQDDRWDRVDTLRESAAATGQQADNILGNAKPLVYKPPKRGQKTGVLVIGKPVPPADFDKPPYSKFKDFQALSVANAGQQKAASARNLARAEKTRKRIENCNKVFPKSKSFWIF